MEATRSRGSDNVEQIWDGAMASGKHDNGRFGEAVICGCRYGFGPGCCGFGLDMVVKLVKVPGSVWWFVVN